MQKNVLSRPSQLDLRRRNSDPATQLPPPPVPPPPLAPVYSPTSDLLEWKGTSMFTIAGHKFRKVARFSKEDRCSFCDKTMDAFVTQGHKCTGQSNINMLVYKFPNYGLQVQKTPDYSQ